jgi:hypothetical protein
LELDREFNNIRVRSFILTGAPAKALLRAAAARNIPDLWQAIAEALKRFTTSVCRNYLAAAGYDAF